MNNRQRKKREYREIIIYMIKQSRVERIFMREFFDMICWKEEGMNENQLGRKNTAL